MNFDTSFIEKLAQIKTYSEKEGTKEMKYLIEQIALKLLFYFITLPPHSKPKETIKSPDKFLLLGVTCKYP